MVLRRFIFIVLVVLFSMVSLAHSAPRFVRIAAMTWEPYSSPSLKNGGFYTEIVHEAFARVGYEMEVDFYPWKRALLLMKEGRVDGLIGAGYTEERTEFMSYPTYAWESDFYFFHTGKGQDKVADFKELCPATLGQLRGTRVTKLVEAQAPCIDIEYVDTISKNLDKLVYGRVDYMINTPETMRHLMQSFHPDNVDLLKAVEPPLEHVKIYTVFSKQVADWRTLTVDFDKGVKLLKKDGTYEAILRKHGMK